MNQWIGTIRFTRDPEIKTSQNGNVIAKFGGACNRRYKQDGQPDADFFEFTAFGGIAEVIDKHCTKGTKVIVTCEIRNNNYEKDGVMHYGTQFIVNSLEFCESKKTSTHNQAQDPSEGFEDGVDTELPF